MSPRVLLFLLAVACLGAGACTSRTGSEHMGVDRDRANARASSRLSEGVDEWSLWSGGTQLRGANTWQKRQASADRAVTPLPAEFELRKLRSWGANYVNLSHPGVYSEILTGASAAYRLDPEVWESLELMIARAEHAGLLVVVSFRTGPGRNEAVFGGEEGDTLRDLWHSEAAQDAWVQMWRTTAERLRSRRNVVGYDLMVEPLNEVEQRPEPVPEEVWNALAERLISGIRDVDPETPILLGGAGGGTVASLRTLDPRRFDPQGTRRIVYTVHQYEPFSYTHQPNEHSLFDCRTGDPRGTTRHPPPLRYTNSVRNVLLAQYDTLARFSDRFRVAVAVNEFGVMRWAPGADRFLGDQIRLIEQLGANHAIWLWEPEGCLGYDEMNFRNGANPANHAAVPASALVGEIKRAWGRNPQSLPSHAGRGFRSGLRTDKCAAEGARLPEPAGKPVGHGLFSVGVGLCGTGSRRVCGAPNAISTAVQLLLARKISIGQVSRRPPEGVRSRVDQQRAGDRGVQYLSIRYAERLAEAGIEPAVGNRGDSYDDALAGAGHRPLQDGGDPAG